MQLQIFIQANNTVGKKLKTCQEGPIKMNTFEWSQEWLSYRVLTV